MTNSTDNAIRLGLFTTRTGERRIYVNGTSREKIYYTEGRGYTESSKLPGWFMNSDALRPQTNTSSVGTRRTKDLEAFTLAGKAIIERYGKGATFADVWAALEAGR